MNLDMLYLATDLTGDKRYAEVATRQAEVSMTSHVRKDYSTFHVVNFDQTTGQPTELMTHQGGRRFSRFSPFRPSGFDRTESTWVLGC
jgi:hypothetical protein